MLRLIVNSRGSSRRFITTSASESKWDRIFEGIEPRKSPVTSQAHRVQRSRSAESTHHPSSGSSRHTKMTTQELKAFNRILDATFGSSKPKQAPLSPAFAEFQQTIRSRLPQRQAPPMEDVTTVHSSEQEEIELAVDEKQEEIDHCQNDQELLLWSIGFFQRQSELLKGKGQSNNDPSTPSSSAADESNQDELAKERALYPHIIPRLMKTFRDRYHDPNLALAIFDFTRNFSIQSFLLGCSTSAYNELLKILWKDFRNLKRIAESLDDMDVNGIVPDADTIRLVESIIADLSSRGDLSNAAEIGRILKRMESMSAQSYEDRRQTLGRRKGFVLDDWDDDESSFAFR